MLLLSATGRRNSTVHVSNNTNKYKNRHYQVPYRTSYPVQSSSPVLLLLLLLLLLLQNTNGYLSVVTFLKNIFILETLDSGISLEGMNLPYLLPKGRHQAAAVLETGSMAKNTIMTFCETNHHTYHNRSGPGTRFPMKMYIHGPMDARPVIPHARPFISQGREVGTGVGGTALCL